MNLFEATAMLTLNTSDYEKSIKDAVKQAQQLVTAITETSTQSQEASKKFNSLSEVLTRIVSSSKQTESSTEQVTKVITESGTSAKSASEKFSIFGSLVKDSSEKVSLFGEMLKANILSDAISKGFETIVSGFKKMGDAAKNFIEDSIQVGMAFDSSMAQVAATMGMTVADMESQVATVGDFTGNLREFAEKMGAETAFSAVQAADALNYMALAGYDVEKSMNMLPNVLNLAAAGGMDLANASDMVTDAASALGLTTEQTTEMVDKMAMASSKSNTSVSQLGSAILTVGGTAKMMQGGTTELATVLGILADNGIKGSESGTALRNMLLSLSAPTNEAKKQLDELGVSVFDSSGNIRNLNDIFLDLNSAFSTMTQQGRTEAISNIFNKRDLKSVEALLANVGDRYAELSGYIDDAAGAGEQMAKTQLDNLKGDVTILQSAFEGLKIAISNKVTPSLRAFAQFGGDALSKLTKAMKKNGLNAVGVILPGIIADGIKIITKKIPLAVKTVIKVVKIIGEAISKNADLIADSVNDIVAEVSDYFLRQLPYFIQSGAKILNGIANGISENIAILIPAISQAIVIITKELTKSENITALVNSAIQIMGALGQGLIDAIPILVNSTPEIMSNLGNGLKDAVSLVGEKAPEIMQGISKSLKDNIPEMKKTAETMLNKLATAMKNVPSVLKEKAPKVMSKIRTELSEAVPKMATVADKVVSKIAEAFDKTDKWQEIKDTFAIITDGLPETIETDKGILKLTLSESFDRIKESVEKLTESFQPLIDKFNEWKDSGQAATDTNSFLKGIVDTFTAVASISVDAISRMISGIINLGAWLTDYDNTGAELFRTSLVGISAAAGTFVGVFAGMEVIKKFLFDLPITLAYAQRAISGLSGGLSALWGVLAANPIIAVIAAVAGLVAGFIYLYNTSEKFRNAVDTLAKVFKDFFAAAEKGLEDAGGQLFDTVEDFKESYRIGKKMLADAKKKVLEWAGKLFQPLEDAKTAWDEFWEWLDIGGYFEEKIESAKTWGSDMIDNFISGINQKWNDAAGVISDFAQMIRDYIGFSEPDKGALSNFHTFAPDMMELFAQGMKENQKLVINQAETLAGSLADTFQNPLAIGTEFMGFEIPEISDMTYHIDFVDNLKSVFSKFDINPVIDVDANLIDNISEKLKEITSMKPVIETTFSEMEIPKIPELPEISDKSYEVRFIDNLDSIIEKVKSLADKAVSISAETELIQVQRIISPEYSLPELPDLSLTVDTSIIDKIRDMLANPLEISVRFADSLENIKSMFNAETLETPSRAITSPYRDDYIRQIDEIRNSYATTNNYYNTSAVNNYQNTRNDTENQSRNQKVTVENLNISVPGFNINSDSDIRELVDRSIREISSQLEIMNIRDNRGLGGAGW